MIPNDDNDHNSRSNLSYFMRRLSLKYPWAIHPTRAVLSHCSDDKDNGDHIFAGHFPVNELEELLEMNKSGDTSTTKLSEDSQQSHRLVVLGIDISHFSRQSRFIICAGCVFSFSLLYGFLQELLSVQVLNRKLGLFLAMWQMAICSLCSYFFRRYDKQLPSPSPSPLSERTTPTERAEYNRGIPIHMYLGLSTLRAVDIGMANLSMQYMNYPAKTLMKSSKVLFTMLFGIVILRRQYKLHDYIVAALTFTGLALFLHADSTSSAIFQSMGVIMLVRKKCMK